MWKKIIGIVEWMVGFLLVLAIIYGSYTMSRHVVMADNDAEMVEVILDAGHGGVDPGKVGVNGVEEKDINLSISKKIYELLEKEGIAVYAVRKEDERTDENGKVYSRTEDMKNRVKVINEMSPKLVVSIHQNSYSDERIKGAQVFYYESSSRSRTCAELIQNELHKLDPDNKRHAKGNAEYYLLKNTKVPMVIVECGFLSNWEEAEKLVQEEYQNKLAEAIVEGIKSYLENTSQNENSSV